MTTPRRPELALHRRNLGFTQESLAEYLRVSRNTVARWERGASEFPRPAAAARLAEALGLSMWELRLLFGAQGSHTPSLDGSTHMGPAFHTWESVRGTDDLRAVVQLSRRVIGGHAGFKPDSGQVPNDADIAPLVELLDRRPDAVELCVRNKIDVERDTLVGYLLAYPVRADTTAGILDGSIATAAEIDLDQVATTASQESALYIGMVLGSDLAARATVMDWCLQRCRIWAAAHWGGYLFAKRSTADGQRWLEKYGFVPVTDEDHIWSRQAARPSDQPRRQPLIPATA